MALEAVAAEAVAARSEAVVAEAVAAHSEAVEAQGAQEGSEAVVAREPPSGDVVVVGLALPLKGVDSEEVEAKAHSVVGAILSEEVQEDRLLSAEGEVEGAANPLLVQGIPGV